MSVFFCSSRRRHTRGALVTGVQTCALPIYLAQTPAGDPPIAMHRIASHANVPRKFLELILADLRDAGLLVSRRGKLGGYHLSKPTHLVSLGEIIRIIEWPLALEIGRAHV